MSDRIKKHWPILFLGLLVILYFGPILFLPQPKIFFNPDYGLSDVTHFNLPMRQFLHDSLKNFQLPLWSQEIGVGFPIFAEGQSGDLSILNLTTAWLPAWLSFNLSYIFAFLLMSIFTYLFCREIGLSKISSILSAIVFTWSGANWAHFNHLNQIVTVAWIPVEFWLLEKALQASIIWKTEDGGRKMDFRRLMTENGLVWWLLLSFAISQQVFGGKMQFVVYSLVALALYLVFKIWLAGEFSGNVSRRRALLSQLFLFVVAVVLAVSLSAIQILPSLELTQLSQRAGGLSFEEVTKYPYPLKHLLTFLNPYLLGDSRNGTYPRFSDNWGLFWENTGYIGLTPLLLVFVPVFYLAIRIFRKGSNLHAKGRAGKSQILSNTLQHSLFFLSLVSIFLLLSFGKYSPFSFVFNFPPLNYFRVPSRMLTMVAFSLAILAGFGLEIASKFTKGLKFSKLLVFVLLILSALDLLYFSSTYSPTIEVSKYLQVPKTVEFLRQDSSQFRILDVGASIFWNQIFLEKGWQGQKDCYLRLRELLSANVNLLWGVENLNSYMGITPLEQAKLMGVINSGVLWGGADTIYLADGIVKILGFYNVKYFVSPFNLSSSLVQKVAEFPFEKDNGACPQLKNTRIKIYQNNLVLPRVFMIEAISQDFPEPVSTEFYQISNQNFQNQKVTLTIKNRKDGFLVLADSFYPGWKAYVDDQEKTIYKVNLNQRAVFLPAGQHEVKFTYEPQSLKKGFFISIGAFIFWILSFFTLLKTPNL